VSKRFAESCARSVRAKYMSGNNCFSLGVIARDSGRSTNHLISFGARSLSAGSRGGYWMPRFQPKSALADFGND